MMELISFLSSVCQNGKRWSEILAQLWYFVFDCLVNTMELLLVPGVDHHSRDHAYAANTDGHIYFYMSFDGSRLI